MLTLPLTTAKNILCLGAHCDDIEIGCGGTLLQLLAKRTDLHVHFVVFAATGERGEEARKSATALLAGAAFQELTLHEFRDTRFPFEGLAIKEQFRELQQAVTPDLIFTHRLEDRHQDHRLLAELTWNAFRDHTILEYEIPKFEGDLSTPNCYVRLEDNIARRKIEHTLKHFPSQHAKPWFNAGTLEAVMRLRGVECNAPSHFAEGFTCHKVLLG